jgi:hypothetical protein
VNALAPALPDAVGQDPDARLEGRPRLLVKQRRPRRAPSLRRRARQPGLETHRRSAARRPDLHTPDGELENTGYGAFNGEGALTVRNSSGYFTVRAAHYGGEFKLLEANGPPPGQEEGEEEGPERKLADERVQADWLHAGQAWTWRAGAQYQRHSLIEVSDEVPGGGPGHEATAFDLLLNTFTGRVSATRAWNSGITATFGATALVESNDTRGPIPLVPDADISSGFRLSRDRRSPRQGHARRGRARGRQASLREGEPHARQRRRQVATTPQARAPSGWSTRRHPE